MTPLPVSGRICARTGLVLLPATGQQVWRVAKTAYGPLSPPPRPAENDVDRAGWGRFDVPGARTVYAGSTAECAYAEVLAYYRRRLGDRDPLAADAAAVGLTPTELAAAVTAEWADRGHMRPGELAVGWRAERSLYRLRLPANGWWVQLEHPDSMAAIETALDTTLDELGVAALDVAVLRGPARLVTTTIATWIHHQTLDTDASALGIWYSSRWATGPAFAQWLPAATTPETAGTHAVAEDPLDPADPVLHTVADRFGIRIW